jgi:hypothetical protein
MTSPTATQAPAATKRGDYLWGVVLIGAFLGVLGLVVGVIRLLNPPPTVLATVAMEKGAARASVHLPKAGELRVLLNVRALDRMDRTDLYDDLMRSALTVTASNPEATTRCAAFDGWSGSGNEEKRKRVPRIKEAENACVLKAAPGTSTVTVALDWKGKSPSPQVTALFVTP